jgi:anti-sigma factor RsiW
MAHDPHAQTEELLPWYATGELDAADEALVEAHLSACARCQQQLAVEHQLVEGFRAVAPEVDSGWARLRRRIEAPEPKRTSWIARNLRELGDLVRRPAVAALATAQVAFLALAAAILPSLENPAFVALGDKPAAAPSANVIVMFRPEATEADMRDALKASGASLVGGPTDADAWLLRVSAKARPSAIAKLQSDNDVMMAEPIDGAAR